VTDGDDIATGDNGVLVYYGRPSHFLALQLLLSRDTKDSDDLASLIQAQSANHELRNALSALAGILPPTPEIAVVQAGFSAALALGDVAYKLLRQLTPACLGLYRAAWLGRQHHFGIGRHPSSGVEQKKDFQFAYEIVLDRPVGTS
jgi:hypothetical protein